MIPKRIEEYPFIQAGSYQIGVIRGEIRWIVIHTAENAEAQGSARGLALWARGPIGVSWHFAVDNAETIQCLELDRVAWAAKGGNQFGVHIELCGRAGQTTQQWDDPYSTAQHERVAMLAAQLATLLDIPLIWLTPAEVLAGKRGVIGHDTITEAFQIVGGHRDPGVWYPRQRLIADSQRWYGNPYLLG